MGSSPGIAKACRSRGFTLVEVMVALLIASIVALLSYRGLDALARADRHLEDAAERWLRVHRFIVAFETDVRMAVARGGRDAGGTERAPLIGQPTAGLPFAAQLALMRPNDPTVNAALPVQRAAYRFAEGRIDLLLWPAADLPPYGEPQRITVLDGVSEFSLRFIGTDGVWRDTWPADGPGAVILPRAIELRLHMQDPAYGGPLRRVIAQ
jgi:general secretion pathway protein J